MNAVKEAFFQKMKESELDASKVSLDGKDKHEVFTIGTFTGYFDSGNRRNRTGSSCKVSDSLYH